MKQGKTTFYWDTVDPSSGPREDYAPGAKRSIATVTVADGTPGGRAQAAKDLIGSASVRTVKLGANLVSYLTRSNPMPYPGSDNLYCYSLVNGSGLGVASHGADGVSFSGGYQFQAVFTSRTYQVKEDNVVKAQGTAGVVPSPLFDPGTGGAYPDEGDCLKRGWENTRYVTRRVALAGRLITVPIGFLEFETPPNDGVPVTFPFPEGIANVAYVWHCVPFQAVPFKAISRCLNAINTDSFDFAESQTLMLTSFDYDAQPGPLGPVLADVRYNFLYTPRTNAAGVALGHESSLHFGKDAAGKNVVDYDRVRVVKNADRGIFRGSTRADSPKVDFGDLFRPAQPTG